LKKLSEKYKDDSLTIQQELDDAGSPRDSTTKNLKPSGRRRRKLFIDAAKVILKTKSAEWDAITEKEKQDVLDRKEKKDWMKKGWKKDREETEEKKKRRKKAGKKYCCSSNSNNNTMTLRGPKRFNNRTLNELKSCNSL
jgi:hypothetical protein